jgi:hypothetical protein
MTMAALREVLLRVSATSRPSSRITTYPALMSSSPIAPAAAEIEGGGLRAAQGAGEHEAQQRTRPHVTEYFFLFLPSHYNFAAIARTM